MQPGLTTTVTTVDDQRWLGSKHGTDTAFSVTLDLAQFAGLYPDGYIPSGVLLGRLTATQLVAPYDPHTPAADGSQVFLGILLEALGVRAGAGNPVGACFWHGRVLRANLPIAEGSPGGIVAATPPTGTLIRWD